MAAIEGTIRAILYGTGFKVQAIQYGTDTMVQAIHTIGHAIGHAIYHKATIRLMAAKSHMFKKY